MSKAKRAGTRGSEGSRGFILVIGLLFLVVLTLLSLSMFRSFGLQERIAGNTRDKQRALEAAQSALQYGEWWLTQDARGTGTACNSVVDAGTANAMHVCSNALANPATLPWATARVDYAPPDMTFASGGGVTSGGDIKYQAKPGLYVSFLGMSLDGQGQLYQVSAFGYEGNADTAAIVQSTYQIKSAIRDAGGL
jgi:type IV pilus assembly protein PilX